MLVQKVRKVYHKHSLMVTFHFLVSPIVETELKKKSKKDTTQISNYYSELIQKKLNKPNWKFENFTKTIQINI